MRFGAPTPDGRGTDPTLSEDLRAGLLTVAVTVLVAAPVGLLWAALAPRVQVVVSEQGAQLVDRDSDAFIASDGYFLAAVLIAGVVGGALAWRFGGRHGPAVVPGLAVGGLLAAAVAMVVGGLVGVPVAELVDAGARGQHDAPVRLRSQSALLAWPAASLLTYLVLVLRHPVALSSGSPDHERAPEPASPGGRAAN